MRENSGRFLGVTSINLNPVLEVSSLISNGSILHFVAGVVGSLYIPLIICVHVT